MTFREPLEARPCAALWRDADEQAAARLAGGIRRRPDHRRPALWLERADWPRRRILRADPTELAAGWAARLGERAASRAYSLARRRGGDARSPSIRRARKPRRNDRAGPSPCPRAGPPRRRPDLHGLEHADPRPGGFLPPARPTPSSSATAAPTASTASSPPGSAPPTPAAGRPRSLPATSACCTTSAASPRCATSRAGTHRRRQQRWRRHLRLPPSGGSRWPPTSSRPCSTPPAT